MLDMKWIRTDLERVKLAVEQRGGTTDELDTLAELDTERRSKLQKVEQLKNRRNVVSQEVAKKKREGEDASSIINEMREVSDEIKTLDELIHQLEEKIEYLALSIPNIPHESVSVGSSEEDNVEVRTWGEPTKFSFEESAHWDIAKQLDILDFEAAAKVTGSRFVYYKGLGARLERALMNFMLDLHVHEHNYEEMAPPMIVNSQSMVGTGQLPKFGEDVFKIEDSDYYLIPTAEVPVTNYHRDEILTLEDLPKYFAAFSSCFRSEAGAAGRDTRGLIRQHQFNKIELVKLTKPEDSYAELETLTENAERVLQLLNLPYRVVSLCTGDLGFASAKTYDIEVWMPSNGMYREISSCSNFEDFQARRANIRFRREAQAKPEFVHTLNGSGLAIGRTVAAILENFQQADGTVKVPEVLVPYFKETTIK